ncbi:hypothetical protein BKA69DRAFT_224339 [Paraphysoderma sedebokerense]|nr:hypothetical protein BKA69DRAFT_224339 [Paraphysoderma sedebokerense]
MSNCCFHYPHNSDLLTAQTRTQPQTDTLPLESVAISIPPSISTSMDNMKSLSLSSSHSKSLNQPSQSHQTSLSASGNNPNYQLQNKHTNSNKITDLNSSGSGSGKKNAEVTNQFKCPDTFEQFIHSAFQGVEPDNMTKLSIGNDGFRLPALDCNSDIPKSTKNSAENLSASFTALNISSSNNSNKQSLTFTQPTTFPSESPNSNLLPSNSLSKSNHLSSTSTLNGQSSLLHPSNSFKSGTNSLSSSQVQLHSKAGISSSPSYLSAYQQPQRDNNTPTFKIARRKLSLPVSRRPSSNSNAAATKPSTSSQKLEVPKSQLSKVKSGSNEMIQTQDESNRKPKKALLPKCNSCSTLFVNSTMSKADLDETLRWYGITIPW